MVAAKGKRPAPRAAVKKAWVLTYDHRHGMDIFLFSCEGKAIKKAVDLILEWIDDVEDVDVREKVERHVEEGEYLKAVKVWRGYQAEGFMTYSEALVWEEVVVDKDD